MFQLVILFTRCSVTDSRQGIMIYFKENTAYSRLFYTEIIIHNTHMGVRGNSRFISSVAIINNLTRAVVAPEIF